MVESASPLYVIAVPGTEQTLELSREDVLAGLARGEITPDQWVWCAASEEWKKVGEMPALQPAAPALVRVPVPIAPVVAQFQPIPVQAAVAHQDSNVSRSQVNTRSYVVKEEKDSSWHLSKIVCAVAFIFVVVIVGANYYLVDEPFNYNMSGTPFASVGAHAHLGAFLQPDTLAIHVLNHPGVTEANLGDFFYALARSSPAPPMRDKPFTVISFTSLWRTQFVMQGPDWDRLGQMKGQSDEARREFVLDHLDDATGAPMVSSPDQLNPDVVKTMRDKAWDRVAANLLR